MGKRALILAFALSGSLALAQLDSNTITVVSSRTTTLQPDQVSFSIDISSDLNATLDDVLAAVASAGITVANFQGVSSAPPYFQAPNLVSAPTLDWNFILPVAWSKMKETITSLTALQKRVPQSNSTLTLSFSVQGTQVSSQLQQTQTCSVSDLLSDARAQAQKLASAANLTLGAALAMSTSTSNDTGVLAYGYPYYSFAPPCILTVKFAVTR